MGRGEAGVDAKKEGYFYRTLRLCTPSTGHAKSHMLPPCPASLRSWLLFWCRACKVPCVFLVFEELRRDGVSETPPN